MFLMLGTLTPIVFANCALINFAVRFLYMDAGKERI